MMSSDNTEARAMSAMSSDANKDEGAKDDEVHPMITNHMTKTNNQPTSRRFTQSITSAAIMFLAFLASPRFVTGSLVTESVQVISEERTISRLILVLEYLFE